MISRKLLALSFLFVSCDASQKLTTTGDLSNGRFWVVMPEQVKEMYVVAALDMARLLEGSTRGRRSPSADERFDSIFVPSLTVGEIKKEVDAFYAETTNAPVPIVWAFRLVSAKARGESRDELDRIASSLRKLASEAASLERVK